MLKPIQINKCVLISDNKFELYFGGISSSPPSVWSPAARGQVVCTVQWGIGNLPGLPGIQGSLLRVRLPLSLFLLALLEQVDRSMTDEIMLTCHKKAHSQSPQLGWKCSGSRVLLLSMMYRFRYRLPHNSSSKPWSLVHWEKVATLPKILIVINSKFIHIYMQNDQ